MIQNQYEFDFITLEIMLFLIINFLKILTEINFQMKISTKLSS